MRNLICRKSLKAYTLALQIRESQRFPSMLKNTPRALARRFLTKRIKYPKFLLLILTFVAAYLIFFERNFQPFHNILLSLGYFGSFIAGVMFSYGFTAGPSTAIFLILAKDQNIFLAGFIGGLGALAGDLTIFKLIRS